MAGSVKQQKNMNHNHTSIETIKSEVGRWDFDVAAGWHAGLLGKQRLGSWLVDRRPPDHFLEEKNIHRLLDWVSGRDAAVLYRKRVLNRSVHFVGTNKDGSLVIVRKGWGVPRGQIISQLERKGCFGDVHVFYFDGSEIARTVNCGI